VAVLGQSAARLGSAGGRRRACSPVLHIERVYTEEYVMDFSRCPALEDLEITSCIFEACEFISPSAKRLSFVKCRFGVSPGENDDRSRMSAACVFILV